MKRIVILCDGTWNTADAKEPTHVVRLARSLAPHCPRGHAQVPIYIEGVGTGQGVTALSRGLDRVLGGTMGWGLLANVVEAYRHLVFLYEPYDEIYIFGFSRGAFTARSLAGFIYKTGILDRDKLHLLPKAVDRYRLKTEIDSPRSLAFRTELSRRVATTRAEQAYRRAQGQPEALLLELAYMGVWDTVGALGVPRHFPFAPLINRHKFQFHDTMLSPIVLNARHAVALDERRKTFEPTLWDNVSGPEAPAEANRDGALRQERYFPGDHGTVGGAAKAQGLASCTLDWILKGAEGVGLHADPEARAAISAACDPFGPLLSSDPRERSLTEKLLHLSSQDRAGPRELKTLHPAAIARWWRTPLPPDEAPYRPGSLKQLRTELAMLTPEERGDTPPRAFA